MSTRLVWILICVLSLAVLDATVAWKDRAAESARPPVGRPLVSFAPEAVFRMKITRAGRPPLVLARSREGFVVETSRGYPTNPGRVEVMLTRFLSWTRDRLAGEKAASHAAFQTTRENGIGVRLETASGSVIAELLVGGVTGLTDEPGALKMDRLGRYVRLLPEDEVYVVADFVTGELEPDPSAWLESPIVQGDDSKVAILALGRGNELVQIAFGPPYARLVPDNRPVDLPIARQLARELFRLAAHDVSQDDERAGLSPPRLAIQAIFEGGDHVQLLVGADTAAVGSAAAPHTFVRIPGRPAPLLVPQAPLRHLVSTTASSIALANVLGERSAEHLSRLELGDDAGSVLADHAPGTTYWTLGGKGPAAPSPRPLLGQQAEERLMRTKLAVLALRVADFDPRGADGHGLSSPRLKLAIDSEGERRTVVFGDSQDGNVWARRDDLPCALLVPDAAIQELRAAFADLAK